MKWHRGTPPKDGVQYLTWIDHGHGVSYAMVLEHGAFGWNGKQAENVIENVIAWAEIEPPDMDKPLQPLPEYSQSEGD